MAQPCAIKQSAASFCPQPTNAHEKRLDARPVFLSCSLPQRGERIAKLVAEGG
jgi:hypothetical protein